MTRLDDGLPRSREALAARVRELEELLDAARQTVCAEQRANRDHALICPSTTRPTARSTHDVPTGGAL